MSCDPEFFKKHFPGGVYHEIQSRWSVSGYPIPRECISKYSPEGVFLELLISQKVYLDEFTFAICQSCGNHFPWLLCLEKQYDIESRQ